MNEILKQRIVGAIVITALAAIFVPMLFDDQVPGVDNFTNELSLPQEPKEDMQPLLDDIPKTAEQVLSKPDPVQVDLQAKTIKQSIKDTNLKSWTIQVGSFSKEANALEFRDKLRKSKFTAYVDSVTTGQGTLYRLRVGPELDEKRAQQTQQQLEAQYKVKTLLVSE
ncbi:protein containing Sporulation/cell division region, bacteria domain [methanotrophic bacterial endosymbiont of Bathymodiolus sp.]|nr:protein containing Sporulation/cell division region, bacteria domain [methanotrophic bacterial endosymbiont of Bathymodiolus sp.]